MSDQLALDLAPLEEPAYEEHMTLAERFAAWVDANPRVVELAEFLTTRWLVNHDRCSIDMIFNQMRWESGIAAPDGSAWRLNNDYRSGLARLLMQRHPEWDGVFATRRTPALDAA